MSAYDRRPSHLHLERLQKAAYARLRYPPPTYSVEELLRRTTDNLDVLREGGEFDMDLKQRLEEKALDPSLRHPILENLRRGAEQVSSKHKMDHILRKCGDAPTRYVHPNHHVILKRVQEDIEALCCQVPKLSFAGELQKLSGRVTLSTLPVGDVNARTLTVPGTDEYLIVFDPVFFDFLYNLSNDIARSINASKAQEGARRYAMTGQEESLHGAIRYGDPTIPESFFRTLSAFLGWGLPPPPFPYDEESFSLAEHLRETGARFIAGHEYAHILLGHMQPPSATTDRTEHPGPDSARWNQELEADWLACGILNSVLTARGILPSVRFIGVHFFFIGTMIAELGDAVLRSGQSRQLSDLIPKAVRPLAGTTHPVSALRLSGIDLWLKEKAPPFEFRGTQYFAMLLLEVASALWQAVEPHLRGMHAKGFRPVAPWKGFDVFERG
jgi:hypothetical protein